MNTISPAAAWLVVFAMLAVQALTSQASLTFATIAPRLADALGRPGEEIGYLISVTYAGAMMSSVYASGPLARLGPVRFSQWSVLFAAAGALLAMAGQIWTVVLGSFVIGVGYGMTNPAAALLLTRVALERHRNLMFSVKQTGVPVGGILAALIAPGLTELWGWQAALAAVVAMGLLLVALLQPLSRTWDRERRPDAPLFGRRLGGIATVARSSPLRWLALATFCFAGIQLCLLSFTTTLLAAEGGMSLPAAAGLFITVHVAGTAGRIFWGVVADRWFGGLTVLIAVGVLMAVSAVLLAFYDAAWPAVLTGLVLGLFGMTAVGWNGVFNAEVARRAPDGRVADATGGILFFAFSGVLLGPAGFALLYGQIGSYALTFGTLSVVGAVGALAVLRLRARPAA